MATPSPKPTIKTGNAGVDGLNFPQLPGGGSTTDSNWAAASKATFDVNGFGLPNAPKDGMMTGDQIYQTLNAMAATNDSHWGSIRAGLTSIKPNVYSTKDLKLNWTPADVSSVRDFLTTLHNVNVTNPTKLQSLVGFFNTSLAYAKKSGVSFNTLNAVNTTPITVPAQADLTDAAQQAFSKNLGRSASPAEAADFAKKYQDLIASYGTAKYDAKKAQQFTQPGNPIQFAQTGQMPADVSAKAVPQIQSNVPVLEQPPSAAIAASNFAARQNPAAASAQAAADGLNQFMSMLKGA